MGKVLIFFKIVGLLNYLAKKGIKGKSELNKEEIIVISGYCIGILLSIMGFPLYIKIIPACMVHYNIVVELCNKIKDYIKRHRK